MRDRPGKRIMVRLGDDNAASGSKARPILVKSIGPRRVKQLAPKRGVAQMRRVARLAGNRQHVNQIRIGIHASSQRSLLTFESLQRFDILDNPDPVTGVFDESGSIIADLAQDTNRFSAVRL
jgi:hypothetical protein